MRAVAIAASGVRHVAEVGLQALIIVGIVAALLLVLSPLFKPADDLAGITGASARGEAHITVPDGQFGGTTTATLSPDGSTWAKAECYQAGRLVFAELARSTSSNTATFTLGPSPLWQSGPATCTAEEGTWGANGRWRAVDKTTFNVSG